VAEILWRRKLVCALVAGIILVVGGSLVLSRPKVYQSTSSVALLPVSTNPGILPNYPNLILSLIPTYVQLISSPVLLDQVAVTVPFRTTGAQLANEVHGEALSNAAIINIVAQSPNPAQAVVIASATTTTFLAQLKGNGVVIPRVYSEPTAAQPTPPSSSLLLAVVVVLAAILGAAAGLIWDRLAATASSDAATERSGRSSPADVPDPADYQASPRAAAIPVDREGALSSGNVRPIEPNGQT
jgi:capsular polysaccharide biosynthesis protein